MINNDKNLENYLSEFRPRPLQPLDVPLVSRNLWLRRLAAAAVIVLCVGAGYQQIHQRLIVEVIQRKSRNYLFTRLALADSQQFDRLLFSESPSVLPNLQGKDSTLRVLAKD
jgi:hypothetical protein